MGASGCQEGNICVVPLLPYILTTRQGANVPDSYKIKELLADKDAMELHAAQSRNWIQAGMKEDAKK